MDFFRLTLQAIKYKKINSKEPELWKVFFILWPLKAISIKL